MLRRRAARALLLLQTQQQTLHLHEAAQCLLQVAALHSSSLSLLSSAAPGQQQQPVLVGNGTSQSQQQQYSAYSHHQDYHAAPVADLPQQWQQAQQQSRVERQHEQQRWHALQTGRQAGEHPSDPERSLGRFEVSPQALGGVGSANTGFSPSSHGEGRGSPKCTTLHGAASAGSGVSSEDNELAPGATGVFVLSSPEEQYQHTLAALHVGRSRNLDQLAHMFDPHAVLAAPDRGGAILEALMFAAAKLQDLQLLRQLLRCTAAAGNTLTTTGHRAVLHCLAHCDRPAEALQWLQRRVPEEQLTPQLVRSLVLPMLKLHRVTAAQQALDYAEPKLWQRWQTQLQLQQPLAAAAAVPSHAGSVAVGDLQAAQMPWSAQDLQELVSLRLLTAGAKGPLSAVQQEWQAVQQQARAILVQASQQQQQHLQQPHQQQQEDSQVLLGVTAQANYVVALKQVMQRTERRNFVMDLKGVARPDTHQAQGQAGKVLQEAMLQLLDTYHNSMWCNYAQRRADQADRQQQHAAGLLPAVNDSMAAAAVEQQQRQQRLTGQQRNAQELWQRHLRTSPELSWQVINPAAVTPQQVASAARFQERHLCMQALDGALAVAAAQRNERRVQQLLKLASLAQLMPRAHAFEALLLLRLRQGAPPEALEELLGEMMGWGIVPTVSAYEHVMEAHALHCDLDAAEAVLERMLAAGHHPVLRTYNRLLHGIAMNGSLSAAIRVYNRLRLQGLQPDMQTLRCLFKCVRMYAINVRVATSRTITQAKPGDREAIFSLLSQRGALFASAYSQLAMWQRDMAAAGLKHTQRSLTHLTAALERLGSMEDCLQLAKLAEESRPGDFVAHRAALKVAGRSRNVRHAGEASRLAAQLAQGEGLSRADYLALISSQFWLKQDHEQLLQTVAAMKAAGHDLNEQVLQQLLDVYCHNGMWGEALQVLDDVAAGRFYQAGRSSSNVRGQQHSTGARQQAVGSSAAAAAAADRTLGNDKLWHVVMRKLWERRAPDALLNEFLQHMPPAQLQRFKLVYGLQVMPGQPGLYTLQPLEDWQMPLQLQSQLQRQQQQGEGSEMQPDQGMRQPAQGGSVEHQHQRQQQQQQQQHHHKHAADMQLSTDVLDSAVLPS